MAEASQSDDVVREGNCLNPTSTAILLRSFQEILETTLKRVLAEFAVRLKPIAGPEATELGPSPKRPGLDLSSIERLKAADLRVALLIGKTPESSGLLIDTKTLARLLAISRAHLYRLQAEEALPAPIQVGHVKRWRLGEILEWIEAGCPPQSMWSYGKSHAPRRRGK